MTAKKTIRRPAPKRSQPTRPPASKRPKPASWFRSTADRVLAFVKRPRFLITAGVVIAVLCLAFVPVALLTDNPAFCKSCHGMMPFYQAWTAGAHHDVACISCHVDAGYPARFLHKFSALQEVYAQFATKATFPNYNADIPNARCLRCHADIPTKTVGQFQHSMHLARGVTCAKCHPTTGHKVTFAALQNAGVLNQTNAPAGSTYIGQVFAGSTGKGSALPGHKPVPCQNCHDQVNLQCSFCHTPPPNHFGADCKACHTDPSVPFKQFRHPATHHSYLSRPCARCHPNGYDTVYCTCHKGHPPTD